MSTKEQLYRTLHLNASREHTEQEIRSAFRKRALSVHPNKKGGSAKNFIKLQDAYDKLIKGEYTDGPKDQPKRILTYVVVAAVLLFVWWLFFSR